MLAREDAMIMVKMLKQSFMKTQMYGGVKHCLGGFVIFNRFMCMVNILLSVQHTVF